MTELRLVQQPGKPRAKTKVRERKREEEETNNFETKNGIAWLVPNQRH